MVYCSLKKWLFLLLLLPVSLGDSLAKGVISKKIGNNKSNLFHGFVTPPDSVKPGVYWYFMDGNLSRKGMTDDLEAMKRAGIGSVIFLEVNVGIPRGKETLLSDSWQALFKHAVKETERLGIIFTMGSGPGWAGSGGPWVDPAQSMQHLVAADTIVQGPLKFMAALPIPQPKKPYFGYGTLTDSLRKKWSNYYKDVAVLAFPTPEKSTYIPDWEEKALYYRAPFSSVKGVKAFLATPLYYPQTAPGSAIPKKQITELTPLLDANGSLQWDVPPGKWTIERIGLRNNGAVTRPAPQPGLGFECDKMDTTAFNLHYEAFIGKLLKNIGQQNPSSTGGWKMIHIDSWEMGAQNWTTDFRSEFQKRRHYDPLFYLPAYQGTIVGSIEITERFLWDLRQTAQELVIERHAGHFKKLGSRSGMRLSIEPYDMNPTADMELGAVADVPMCEFWSKNYGYNTSFSGIEATSIAHVLGKPVVQAEAFTAEKSEGWKLYPDALKNQGDWAFALGINKFFYHTFAHQPLDDQLKPGMTMGPYGVHWDRNQTWWPMADAYHSYISRCSYLLQQGKNVADYLYLTPEGAPHVFRPPLSALTGNDTLPDKRGYSFDGCSPGMLMKASVVANKIVFPDGGSYHLLVLPHIETMTPELLQKIESLVRQGACITGIPLKKSPSLVNYPACDEEVVKISQRMWSKNTLPGKLDGLRCGSGRIFSYEIDSSIDSTRPYQGYETTAEILRRLNVAEDFVADGPVRYAHRKLPDMEIYFISNRSKNKINVNCSFRDGEGTPELWNPLNGNNRLLTQFSRHANVCTIPIDFEPHQSFFVIFGKNEQYGTLKRSNFPVNKPLMTLDGNWKVSFDPKWGGPGEIAFEHLQDWSTHIEPGIKYYSGTAIYRKAFLLTPEMIQSNPRMLINLGEVYNLAQVTLNGVELGKLWTAPWSLELTKAIRAGNNYLEIKVVNLWPNRLIGDEQYPSDGIVNHQWPDWLLNNQERNSKRTSFATYNFYKKDAPLLKSGLLGPVQILSEEWEKQ